MNAMNRKLSNAEAQREFDDHSARESSDIFQAIVRRMADHVCDGHSLYYMDGLEEVEINRPMVLTELDLEDQNKEGLDILDELLALLFAKPSRLDTHEGREKAVEHAKKISNARFRITTKAEELIKFHYEAITEYNKTCIEPEAA